MRRSCRAEFRQVWGADHIGVLFEARKSNQLVPFQAQLPSMTIFYFRCSASRRSWRCVGATLEKQRSFEAKKYASCNHVCDPRQVTETSFPRRFIHFASQPLMLLPHPCPSSEHSLIISDRCVYAPCFNANARQRPCSFIYFLYPPVVVSHLDGMATRIDIATTWVILCRALSRNIVNI
jgi:hypothetical protein